MRAHRVARPNPCRRPRTSARASPAAPALISTTVPPAKSITCSRLTSQPPIRAWSPSTANTQCATGAYTSVSQTPANSSHGPNRARSAIAPEISATVIAANVPWKATKASAGTVPTRCVAWNPGPVVPSSSERPKNRAGSPSSPAPASSPKAIE